MTTRKITQKRRKPSLRRNPEELMRGRNHIFTVIFTAAEEGGYIITCPARPGLVTEGDNLREARTMAREAITGYIEVLIKDVQPVPEDSRIRAEQIGIDVLAAA